MKKTKDKEYLILTINPGSTSTKIGVFRNEEPVFDSTVRHSSKMLEQFPKIWDQYTFRKDEIVSALEKNNIALSDLDAVVGRGGLIKPIPSGVYQIDEDMIEDARNGYQGHHASNLGCVIAYSIGWEFSIPAFIVDPPAVDDLEPIARVSGLNEVQRTSLFHALNAFATARILAKDLNKKFEDLNLIVAHLGGGISVSAIKNGKAINVNNGLDEGPFSPERSGRLPLNQVIKMCFSGKYTEAEMKKMIVGKGGLVSYFNTNKAHEVENMVKAGSDKFRLVFEAMAYQIAEEIGARATNLKGQVDGIILTGGIAHGDILCDWITERVRFIGPVFRYPGELELEALASGALRVLKGEESAKPYTVKLKKIGIYYWDSLEVYVSTINNLEDRFREKGYIFRQNNSNLEIVYANCKSNEEKARASIEKFVDAKLDIIFAVGSPSSIRAAQYLKSIKIPVIFTGIYNPSVLTEIDWNADNYYASCYAAPISEQLENTVLKVNPDLKKIGLMYKIGELQSDIQHDEMRFFCAKKNIELVSLDIQSQEDFPKALKFFKNAGIEWLFLGADTIIATSTEQQLEVFTNNFLTVCILANTVAHGGLISYQTPWKEVANAATDIAIKIFNEVPIKDRILKPASKQIVINQKAAEKHKFAESLNKFSDVKFV